MYTVATNRLMVTIATASAILSCLLYAGPAHSADDSGLSLSDERAHAGRSAGGAAKPADSNSSYWRFDVEKKKAAVRNIKRAWFPPKNCMANSYGTVVIRLFIDPDGLPGDVRLVRGSGWQHWDDAALSSVRNAGPFKWQDKGQLCGRFHVIFPNRGFEVDIASLDSEAEQKKQALDAAGRASGPTGTGRIVGRIVPRQDATKSVTREAQPKSP